MARHLQNISNEIKESYDVKKLLLNQVKIIEKISLVISKAISANHTVFLLGNGGSAADAQHIAAELVGQFSPKKRPALPAIALTTNSSLITAIANDASFDNIFYRQIEAFVKKNDIVIAISTSGKSKNVLKGVKLAKLKGAQIISLTGKETNPLSKISDISLHVPSKNTQRIQECHILIGHIICGIVEKNWK